MQNVDLRHVVATDRLGRQLQLDSQAPAQKDRLVGLFYFICLSQKGTDGPYDVEKILAQDPTAATNADHPLWGGIDGVAHHWGEPLFGYYFTRDEWVIRKHIEMMAMADVDFIVFDTTNRAIFFDDVTVIMRLIEEYIHAGYRVPKVAFMTNTKSGETVNELYERIYAPGLYRDSWFTYEGKPFIIGVKEECSPAAQVFFTFRTSQWPNQAAQPGGFPWMEFIRPQRVFRDETGAPEVINVSVAQHPNCAHSDAAFFGYTDAWGRSYHNGAMDGRFRAVDHGFNVQEQWDYAISVDPKMIFITGWNEWTAGRWSWHRDDESCQYTVSNDYETVHYVRSRRPEIKHTFCDCCNEEYSRDIEPMKGGYFDNYWLQMIANIRRYKGLPAQPADDGTGLCYADYPWGNAHRDCRGFGPNHYTNTSGVNDIARMTVRKVGENMEFTVQCAADILPTGHWLQLRVNTVPGTPGYDLMVIPGTDTAAILKNGEAAGAAGMALEGDTLTLTLPAALLPAQFEFKWTDQIAPDAPMEDYYTQGDCAPYGRANYLYR